MTNIKQDYFKIWSHNMAYVLGFWFAVGYIYGGKFFDISIHKKDKYIIKKIAQELGYNKDISDKQLVRINFNSIDIYNDIIAFGGKEIKNNDIKFPNIPIEFLPDFIRGYFDANGDIKNLKNNRINLFLNFYSKDFLIELLKVFRKEIGVQNGSFDFDKNFIKFGKKDTIKIGEYMYKNNPELFLLRKRQKFML